MIEALGFGLLTIAVFLFWMRIQKRADLLILNPLLFSLFCIVGVLTLMDIDYQRYMRGASYISFFVEPCVVALGYPLFKQLKMIGRQWRELVTLCLLAVFTVLTVSALLARWMGIEDWVIRSLVILCITTAIAMETSEALGGAPSLAALTVMIAGFTGSAFGMQWLMLMRIREPRAVGLAIGSTAHALGTATIARYSYESSAYASTALILCAIFTAIVAPLYIPFLLSL